MMLTPWFWIASLTRAKPAVLAVANGSVISAAIELMKSTVTKATSTPSNSLATFGVAKLFFAIGISYFSFLTVIRC